MCVYLLYPYHSVQEISIVRAKLSQIIVLEKYDSVERGKKVRCDIHPSGYYS